MVPVPGRSTLFKLADVLAAGRHTFGSAVTRRRTANRPQGTFTPTHASRPGEQVQIDSTSIDVLVLLDNCCIVMVLAYAARLPDVDAPVPADGPGCDRR